MIQFQEVNFLYQPGKEILKNLNFTISKGEIIALLGPNGAGKTTFLRLIAKLIEPSKGTIIQPITQEQIGYLPEERGLYKKMKVKDFLTFIAQLKSISPNLIAQKIKQYSSELDFEHYLNQEIDTLSKGNQQKIQLASALINEPQLLILDEPFSGFDPINAQLLFDLIQKKHHEGVTILISTHRMEQVETLCERMILINQGKIILDSIIEEEIANTFNNQYIALFSQEINFDKNSKISLHKSSINRYHYLIDGTLENIFEMIAPYQKHLISIQKNTQNIQEIFINQIKKNA